MVFDQAQEETHVWILDGNSGDGSANNGKRALDKGNRNSRTFPPQSCVPRPNVTKSRPDYNVVSLNHALSTTKLTFYASSILPCSPIPTTSFLLRNPR